MQISYAKHPAKLKGYQVDFSYQFITIIYDV